MSLRFFTAALLLTTAGLALPVQAASLNSTLTGERLLVDTPCADHVEIAPDPALHGQVVVHAAAENQQEIDQLVLSSNQAARIGTRPGRCWSPSPFGFHRTLTLTIRVPGGFPLALDEAGAGSYTVGPVGGSMDVDFSGAADLIAAKVTTLKMDLSGAGRVDVGQADGAADVKISGHGEVTIGHATMPSLEVDLSGAGSLAVKDGQIDGVKVDDSGAGAITIGAGVGQAAVDVSGIGNVHFARLSGRLQKDVSGLGSVTVGN